MAVCAGVIFSYWRNDIVPVCPDICIARRLVFRIHTRRDGISTLYPLVHLISVTLYLHRVFVASGEGGVMNGRAMSGKVMSGCYALHRHKVVVFVPSPWANVVFALKGRSILPRTRRLSTQRLWRTRPNHDQTVNRAGIGSYSTNCSSCPRKDTLV